MNEVMSLEQLEALARNPNYKLSQAQVDRLEKLREDRYRNQRKHKTPVPKHSTMIKKHGTVLEEPQDGIS